MEFNNKPCKIDKYIRPNKYNVEMELLYPLYPLQKENIVNENFQIFENKLNEELDSILKVLFDIKHIKFNFDLFTLNNHQLLELKFELDYGKELLNINLSIRKPLYLVLILNLMNNIYMKLGNKQNIESVTFSFLHKDNCYSRKTKINKYGYIIDENIDVLINFFKSLNNVKSIVFSEIDENIRFGELKDAFRDIIEIKDKKSKLNIDIFSSNLNFNKNILIQNFSNSIDKINKYEIIEINFLDSISDLDINIKQDDNENKISINFKLYFKDNDNQFFNNNNNLVLMNNNQLFNLNIYLKLMNILLSKLLEVKNLKSLFFNSCFLKNYIDNDNIDLLKELILLNNNNLKSIEFKGLNPCSRFDELLNVFEYNNNIEKLVIPFYEKNIYAFFNNKSIKDLTLLISFSEIENMNNIDNINTFIENINANFNIPVKTKILFNTNESHIFIDKINRMPFMKKVIYRNFDIIMNYINTFNENNNKKYKNYLNEFKNLENINNFKKKFNNSIEDKRIHTSLEECFLNNLKKINNLNNNDDLRINLDSNNLKNSDYENKDYSKELLSNGFSNLGLSILNSIKLFNNTLDILNKGLIHENLNTLDNYDLPYTEEEIVYENKILECVDTNNIIEFNKNITNPDINELMGIENFEFNNNNAMTNLNSFSLNSIY